MSNSVDQRIVQMMFDNSEFEKGVSSTLQSLKALDEGLTLKNGSSGIEQVQKSVEGLKFDNAISQAEGFGGALEKLKGTASNVFSGIMDSVSNMSTGLKVVTGLLGSGLAGMMISGAWNRASNINEAQFKLRGMYEAMGYEGEKAAQMVSLAMENASNAVDGTAYSLDSAAMAASNLAASGVAAGEDLEGTLKAIAGLASMSGRDYDSVAQIVATVAGQGQLMTMQLRQFEMSGLNVAAILAKDLGKSEEEIRKLVTDGAISFEIFSEIMEKNFAGAAEKANETFTGSLANIRAALSRTLADFFQFGQNGMVPIFNGIRMGINQLNTAAAPLLGKDGVLTQGVYNSLTALGETLKAWNGYEDVIEEIDGKLQKTRYWNHPEELEKNKRLFQGIADALQAPLNAIGQMLPNMVMSFMYFAGIVREVVRLFGELIGPVFTGFRNVFSDNFFGAVSGWFAGLVKHIYDLVSALKIGRAYTVLMEGVFTALFSVIKVVAGAIGTGLTIAVRIVSDAFFFLVKSVEIVLDVIGAFLDLIGMAIGFVADLFGWFEKVGSDSHGFGLISKTFRNIGTAVGMFIDVLSGKEGAFDTLVSFIRELNPEAGEKLVAFGSAVSFLGMCFANAHVLIDKGAHAIADAAYKVIEPSLPAIKLGLSRIGKGITDFIRAFGEGISTVIPEKLRSVGEGIASFFGAITGIGVDDGKNLVDRIGDFFSGLKDGLESGDWLSKASAKVLEFSNSFAKFADEFQKGAVGKAGEILEFIRNNLENLSSVLGPVSERLAEFGKSVVDAFGRFVDVLGSNGIVDSVKVLGDWLSRAFRDLFGGLKLDFADSVGSMFKAFGSNLVGIFRDAANAISEFFKGIPDLIGSVVASISDFLKSIGLEQVASVLEVIGSILSAIASGLSEIVGWIFRLAGGVLAVGLIAFGTALFAVYSALRALAPYVASVGKTVVDFFMSVADIFSKSGLSPEPLVKFFEGVGTALDSLINGLGDGQEIGDALKSFGDAVKSNLDSLFGDLGPKVKDLIGNLWAEMASSFGSLIQNFFGTVGEVLSNIPKLVGGVIGVLDFFGVFDGLKEMGFEKPLKAIQDFFNETAPGKIKEISEGIGKFFAPALERLGKLKDDVFSAFKDSGILASVEKFGGVVKDAFKVFLDAVSENGFTWEAFKDLGSKIREAFSGLIQGIIPSIGEFAGGLWSALSSNIGGPLGDFLGMIGDAVGKIPEIFKGIGSVLDSLGVFDALKSFNLDGPINAVKGFFSGIAELDIGKAISNFTGIGKAVDTVKDFFHNFKSIDEGLDPRQRSIGQIFKKVIGESSAEEVEAEGERLGGALEAFSNFINDPIGSVFDGLSNVINIFGDKYAEFKKSIDTEGIKTFVDDIFEIAKKAGHVVILFEVVKMFEATADFMATMGRFAKALSSIAWAVKNTLLDFRNLIRTQAILNIAIAVGIIVAALIILSKQPIEEVTRVLPIVIGLLVGMVAIAALLGVIGKYVGKKGAKAAEDLGDMMLKLSASIAIMAVCIKILGTMTLDEVVQGGAVVAALMTLVIVIVGLMTKLPPLLDITGMAATFMALAGAIAIMALVINVLGSMDGSKLGQGLALLVGLMVLFGVLVAAMEYFSTGISVAAKGFMEMAASIALISAGVYILSKVDPSRIGTAVAAISALMIVSSLLIVFLTNFTGTVDLAGATKSMVALAEAVLIMSIAIGALAIVSAMGGNLLGPTMAVIALLIAVSAAIVLIGSVDKMAKKAVVAVTAFAVAIAILSAAIIAMTIVPIDKLCVSFLLLVGTIAVVTIAFVVFGAAANVFKTGILAVAALFASFAVAALSFGASALMIASAISKLAEVGPKGAQALIDSISIIAKGLWEKKEEIAMGIAAIAYAVIKGIASMVPMAAAALLQAIGELAAVLVAAVPIMVDAGFQLVTGILNGLSDGIDKHGEDILSAVVRLGEKLLTGVVNAIKDAGSKLGEWLWNLPSTIMGEEQNTYDAAYQVGSAVADGMDEGNTAPEVTEQKMDDAAQAVENSKLDIWEKVKGLAKGIGVNLEDGIDTSASGFDWLKSFGLDSNTINKKWSELLPILQEKGIDVTTFLQSGIDAGVLNIPNFGDMLQDNGNLDMSQLEGVLGDSGIGAFMSFSDKFVATASQDSAVLEVLSGDKVIDQGAITESFAAAGQNAAESFSTGFESSLSVDGTGPVEKAAEALKMPEKFRAAGLDDGKSAVDGLAKGLSEFSGKAKSVTEKAIKEIKDKKSSGYNAAHETGQHIGKGLAAGFEAAWPAIQAVCNKIIAKIDETARKKSETKSPSRMTMRIGRYIGEGLAVGMEQMQGRIIRAAGDMTGAAISAASVNAGYLTGLLEDIEDQPVIRPVLDLTDYNAGLAMMERIDTRNPMMSAQLAGRMFSIGSPTDSSQISPGNTYQIEVNLNYDAGADANQIVMDIAQGLSAQLAMEGV